VSFEEKSSMTRSIPVTLLALACAAFAVPAFADPPSGKPPKPPQEAFDACASAKEGDPCSVTFHDKTMSGVCHGTPDGLACRPDGMPSGPPPGGS
jgi:hypothetical protein